MPTAQPTNSPKPQYDSDSASDSDEEGSQISVTEVSLGLPDGQLEKEDESNPLVSRIGGRVVSVFFIVLLNPISILLPTSMEPEAREHLMSFSQFFPSAQLTRPLQLLLLPPPLLSPLFPDFLSLFFLQLFQAWLPLSSPPPKSISICSHCSKPMQLLVQIFAPLIDSAFDRTLLVWGCSRRVCQRKGDGR